MKQFFYGVSLMGMVITLYDGFERGLLGLNFFAVSPYVGLLGILYVARAQAARWTAYSVCLFLVSVGLYFLIDTTYMERNLAYKFSFLFMPIWQWTMLLFSGFVVYLSNGKQNSH